MHCFVDFRLDPRTQGALDSVQVRVLGSITNPSKRHPLQNWWRFLLLVFVILVWPQGQANVRVVSRQQCNNASELTKFTEWLQYSKSQAFEQHIDRGCFPPGLPQMELTKLVYKSKSAQCTSTTACTKQIPSSFYIAVYCSIPLVDICPTNMTRTCHFWQHGSQAKLRSLDPSEQSSFRGASFLSDGSSRKRNN